MFLLFLATLRVPRPLPRGKRQLGPWCITQNLSTHLKMPQWRVTASLRQAIWTEDLISQNPFYKVRLPCVKPSQKCLDNKVAVIKVSHRYSLSLSVLFNFDLLGAWLQSLCSNEFLIGSLTLVLVLSLVLPASLVLLFLPVLPKSCNL